MLKKIFLLVLLFGYGNCVYQEKLARNYIWPLTVDAYYHGVETCISKTLGSSSNYEFGAQTTVQCDKSSVRDTCSGYTVAYHPQRAVIIVFRGSVSGGQVNQEQNETLSSPLLPFVGGGNVNSYFYNGYQLLWNNGMKNSFLKLRNKYPSYKVWVAGHSLGAAIASITAASLSATNTVPRDQLMLYTFGQPRTGDKGYADAYAKLVPDAYRIVHHWDAIPHEPAQGYKGYTHHKTEIWYNNNMAKGDPYITCPDEESPNCSNSVKNPIESDHGTYFGVKNYLGNHGCVPAGSFF